MDEFISHDLHHAEVAALQNEIYRLTKYISDTEAERLSKNKTDPHNSFDNPTEYHNYNDDYTEIQPLILTPDYKPELEPAADERSGIKRYYSVGGWCNLLRFFLATSLMMILQQLVVRFLESGGAGTDRVSVYTYLTGSSLFFGLNMLVFGLTNLGLAIFGMRLSNQRMSSLFKTGGFTFLNFLQYSLIGFSLWFAAVMLGQITSSAFAHAGIDINVLGEIGPVTGKGMAVYAVYTCIVAPLTEELFYRGMMLKVFSKANQRFGVFFTALMFGLGHGNINQLILGFILGIFLAHITLRHNSIIPSIAVHAVLNAMTVLLSMFEFTVHEQRSLVYAGMLAAFIGLMLLILFRSENKLPSATPAQIRRGSPVASASIGVILSVAVQVIYMFNAVYQINK